MGVASCSSFSVRTASPVLRVDLELNNGRVKRFANTDWRRRLNSEGLGDGAMEAPNRFGYRHTNSLRRRLLRWRNCSERIFEQREPPASRGCRRAVCGGEFAFTW